MEDKRKDLMVAGLYLGDVTLLMAAITEDLPSYVQGFDLERVIPEAGALDGARAEIDSMLAGRDRLDEIPPEVLHKVLATAVEKGKFLSASRCLDLLGERDRFVEDLIAGAGPKLKAGDAQGAARDLCVASNLESETAFPLFQYSGPELHAGCSTAPESCMTRAGADEAVKGALEYLLEGERVLAFIAGLDAGEQRSLFPHVALDRDPDLHAFYAAFKRTHAALSEIEEGDLGTLKSDMRRAAEVAAELERYLRGASPYGDGAAALDRARRMASGFVKDLQDIEILLETLQLKRIKRRVGNMLESAADLRGLINAVRGGEEAAPLAQAIALVEDFGERALLDKIDGIETRLVGLQIDLLGRPVHSQEHWQYLRELAFKYPVSPVMCCIRRLNDRYMVIPRWDGALTAILREFLDRS